MKEALDNVMIGIDLGGTFLRIGALAGDNTVIAFNKISSRMLAKADKPVEELKKIIEGFRKENRIENICAVSIGVPSSVANDKETVICTTNMINKAGEPMFKNTNLAAPLREYFGVPVFVNNDIKNILQYDMHEHNLEQKEVVVGIYIGTGAGAAVMIHGNSMDGADGAALDIGHMPFYKGTYPCNCGKKGCCECYASGWKLEKIREEYFPESEIGKMFAEHGKEPVMQEFLYACSHLFSVLITIFNPNTVVAGGGVMEMEGFPREEFEKLVRENTGTDVMSYGFDFVYSHSRPEKGAIGAALFAKQKLKEQRTSR